MVSSHPQNATKTSTIANLVAHLIKKLSSCWCGADLGAPFIFVFDITCLSLLSFRRGERPFLRECRGVGVEKKEKKSLNIKTYLSSYDFIFLPRHTRYEITERVLSHVT